MSLTIGQILGRDVVQSIGNFKLMDSSYNDPVDTILNRCTSGLSTNESQSKRMQLGPNMVTSPQNCPSWLCCLLPFLKNTNAMQFFRACEPDSALVIRDGHQMRLAATGLVVGDIVMLKPGDIIPADIRLLKADGPIEMVVFDSPYQMLTAELDDSNEYPLYSRNICWAGCAVSTGTCSGIVIQTGKKLLLSRIIEAKHWPLPQLLSKDQGVSIELLGV